MAMPERWDPAGFKGRIDAVLADFVAEEAGRLLAVDEALRPVADQLRASVGHGKRLRAAFCYWGWRTAGQPDSDAMARAQYPAFFRDAARLEGEAVELHVYATKAVPGLLQSDEYARAVFTMWRPLLAQDVIEERVAARLARQGVFSGMPQPTISFVIEESVLRRPLGGRAVMRGQLEHVLLAGQLRHVEIQVVPTELEEHAGLEGPFTLIETRDGRRIAYVEGYKDSRLHTERQAVRELEEQYGILRAQALTPRASLAFVEELLGEQ
ncbi:DUF5753 domain-containing protein [Streptomyces sp. NPDC049910]|uniref:DUF5753 domain-containing protein n=1 Tax=Streptomyces sp. NPDC049910 TaxID=3155278 RepID=UPI0034422DA4